MSALKKKKSRSKSKIVVDDDGENGTALGATMIENANISGTDLFNLAGAESQSGLASASQSLANIKGGRYRSGTNLTNGSEANMMMGSVPFPIVPDKVITDSTGDLLTSFLKAGRTVMGDDEENEDRASKNLMPSVLEVTSRQSFSKAKILARDQQSKSTGPTSMLAAASSIASAIISAPNPSESVNTSMSNDTISSVSPSYNSERFGSMESFDKSDDSGDPLLFSKRNSLPKGLKYGVPSINGSQNTILEEEPPEPKYIKGFPGLAAAVPKGVLRKTASFNDRKTSSSVGFEDSEERKIAAARGANRRVSIAVPSPSNLSHMPTVVEQPSISVILAPEQSSSEPNEGLSKPTRGLLHSQSFSGNGSGSQTSAEEFGNADGEEQVEPDYTIETEKIRRPFVRSEKSGSFSSQRQSSFTTGEIISRNGSNAASRKGSVARDGGAFASVGPSRKGSAAISAKQSLSMGRQTSLAVPNSRHASHNLSGPSSNSPNGGSQRGRRNTVQADTLSAKSSYSDDGTENEEPSKQNRKPTTDIAAAFQSLSLDHVLTLFPRMNMPDRHNFMLLFLSLCDQYDMKYLYQVLPNLHRNFLILLPTKIAFKILSFLHPRDLISVSLVSRQWNRMLNGDTLWKSLYSLIRVPLVPLVNFWDGRIGRNACKYYLLTNWVSQTYQEIRLDPHDQSILAMCLKWPFLVTGSADRTIKVLDIRDIHRSKVTSLGTLEGHEDDVTCLQLLDGHIISGSSDKSIRIWSIDRLSVTCVLSGHGLGVTCVKAAADYIVSGSSDKTIRVWRLDRSRPPTAPRTYLAQRVLRGHSAGIRGLQFDESVIISVSNDRQVRIWHLNTGNCLQSLNISYNGLSCMYYDPGRRTLLFGTFDGTVHVWEVKAKPDESGNPVSPQSPILNVNQGNDTDTDPGNIVENGKSHDDDEDKEEEDEEEEDEEVKDNLGDYNSTAAAARRRSRAGSISVGSGGGLQQSARARTESYIKNYQRMYEWATDKDIFVARTSLKMHQRQWVLDCQMDDWRIISAGSDGTINVHNLASEKSIFIFKSHNNKPFTAFAYDDKVLIAGAVGGGLYVWDFM